MAKFIVKPGTPVDFTPKEKVVDPKISDISIDDLLGDGLLVLYREIHQLKILSARGKLEPNDSKDLRDHLKLLFELKEREAEILKGLSNEELQKQAKQVVSGENI